MPQTPRAAGGRIVVAPIPGVQPSAHGLPNDPAFSLRNYTGITPNEKACRPKDAQAFGLLVAKGGIEPPTHGFSGHPYKRDLIVNQALAIHATFREQPYEGWNESNEAKKSYDSATVPIS